MLYRGQFRKLSGQTAHEFARENQKTLGVWIELGPMPERARPIEKGKENLGFLFQHFQPGGFKNQRFFDLLSSKASKNTGFSMVFGLGRPAGADPAR